jgi:hypothetical protein
VSLDSEPIKPTLMSADAVAASINDAIVATTFIKLNFIKSSIIKITAITASLYTVYRTYEVV